MILQFGFAGDARPKGCSALPFQESLPPLTVRRIDHDG
jgi:hypothetical protein